MKIMHVVMAPRYSGAEVLVASMAELHCEIGHQTMVVALKRAEDAFLPVISSQASRGINWVSPDHERTRWDRVRAILSASLNFRPDVIFAHSEIPSQYARVVSSRVIPVLHSQSNFENAPLSWGERVLWRRSAAVIAVSQVAKSRYAARYPSVNIRHIPNGVRLSSYTSDKLSKDRDWSVIGGPRILQVGRIDRIKRQDLTIEAFAAMALEFPKAQLFFAGLVEDVEYLESLKKRTSELGYSDRVHFLGSRSDVSDLLRSADLFVMPSKIEAQGIALIEALATGLPVICSNIAGFAFAQGLAGVAFVSVENKDLFAGAMTLALRGPRWYERDMSEHDLRTTATDYVNFAIDVLGGV